MCFTFFLLYNVPENWLVFIRIICREILILFWPFFFAAAKRDQRFFYGLIFPNMIQTFRRRLIRLYRTVFGFISVWFLILLLGRLDSWRWLVFWCSISNFGWLVYWFRAIGIVIMLFDTFRLRRFILIICCHSLPVSQHDPNERHTAPKLCAQQKSVEHLIMITVIFHLFVTISYFQQCHPSIWYYFQLCLWQHAMDFGLMWTSWSDVATAFR